MRGSRSLCFIAALFLVPCAVTGQPAAGPWPMFRHDAAHSAMADLPGPSVPGLIWSYNPTSSGIPFSGIFSGAAVASDSRVYVGGLDNNFYVLTPRAAVSWSYNLGTPAFSSPALCADGRVVAGSSDRLFCFNAAGTLSWSCHVPDFGPSSPAIGPDGSVYVGSAGNTFYAFSSSGSLAWTADVGTEILSSPAVASGGGRIYIGMGDNNFYAGTAAGALAWSYETGDIITSSPAVAGDGRIYFGSDDNNLYSLNANGSLSWSYAAVTDSIFINSSPALTAGGNIYVSSSDSRFFSFASNGSVRWSYRTVAPLLGSPVVGQDDVGYTVGFEGSLQAYNSNGTLLWTYGAGGFFPLSIGSNLALGDNRRIFLSTLSYLGGGGGGLQVIAERPPSVDVIPSSNTPAVGEPFSIDVTVKPLGGAFDAWGVIFGPGGAEFSFVLGNPGALREGMEPLALNVPGLPAPFAATLLSLPAIPAGAAGTYDIYVGLVPAGRAPNPASAIPDYLDHETVVVR